MATSYSIIPTGEIKATDRQSTREWLRQHGAEWPDDVPEGKRPTPRDVRTVLNSLDEYRVTYDIGPYNWRATLDRTDGPARRPHAVLEFHGFAGDESYPGDLRFAFGWPELVVQILERLSRLCGTVIVLANDDRPALVSPGVDPPTAVRNWLPPNVLRAESYAVRLPMGADDFLAFLAEYEQPTDPWTLTDEELDWYVDALDHATGHPDPRFARAFLMAFPEGMGGAGFDTTLKLHFHRFELYSTDVLVGALREALASANDDVRARAAEVGCIVPNEALDLLYYGLSRSPHEVERSWAATYLCNRGTPEARRVAKQALASEDRQDIRKKLERTLQTATVDD